MFKGPARTGTRRTTTHRSNRPASTVVDRTIPMATTGHSPTAGKTTRPDIHSREALDTLKTTLRQLRQRDDPVHALENLRCSDLYNEVYAWSRANQGSIEDKFQPLKSPHARNAADAAAVCYALDAVVELTGKYDLKLVVRKHHDAAASVNDDLASNRHFLQQIKPDHARFLAQEFLASWKQNDVTRQAAILSAIAPDVAARLGLTVRPEHIEKMRDWPSLPQQALLTEAELLALVDYLNSRTRSFNAVNGALIACAYYGEPVLKDLVAVLATPLVRAIKKLCEHPYFGRRNITTYKGIRLADPSAPFRLAMLQAALGTNKRIAFPNVLSATADPNKSYVATKYDLGFDLECEITMKRAFDADPFHDTETMGEMEIVGPPDQVFTVPARQTIYTRSMETSGDIPIDRYIMKPFG